MRESDLWKKLKDGMGDRWVADRIENDVGVGTPDVAYSTGGINGWIELKYIRSYPQRYTTPILIPHLTSVQCSWLRRHGEAGGHCFLLIRIQNDFYLFSWRAAKLVKDGLTREGFKTNAVQWWNGTINWVTLASILGNPEE